MQSSNDSQCHFVQLQIDSFLDGDLVASQQDGFLGHVQTCDACAKELHFARNLHDAVMDLPTLDCPESVLAPIHRLSQVAQPEVIREPAARQSIWESFVAQVVAVPLTARLVIPAFALILISLSINLSQVAPEMEAPQLIAEQEQDYSVEEIQKALSDLNLAIEYLNDVSQRTEVMIGERFIVTPLQDSINASFDKARDRSGSSRQRIQNNPI